MKVLFVIVGMFFTFISSATPMNTPLKKGDLIILEVTKNITIPFNQKRINLTLSTVPSVLNQVFLSLKTAHGLDRTIAQGENLEFEVLRIVTDQYFFNLVTVDLIPKNANSSISALSVIFHPNQNGATIDGFKNNAESILNYFRILSIESQPSH